VKYLELELASAKARDPERYWTDPEWLGEEKLDGWRFALHFGGALDRPYLTGRRHSTVTGFLAERGLNVRPLWPSGPLPGYTVVDGEILPPDGADFRDLSSIVGRVSPEDAAAAIERLGPPRYVVFDVLFADGQDVRGLSLLERRVILEGVNCWELIPQTYEKHGLYDRVCADGGEGVVLKNICAPYGESGAWIKVKKTVTLDVVITGFTEAKPGKFAGLIGAALVSVHLPGGVTVEIGKVSGMDDATRAHMTVAREQWLGRVIEVRCAGWAKERLWHPVYVRRRDDADPRTCTYEKMMRDLGRGSEDRPHDGEQLDLF
jgi:bifunctional non-homologous end joining protein LigD